MGIRANVSVPLRILTSILCLLLAAGFHDDVFSQSTSAPSTQPFPLTLGAAVQLALKQNPQVVSSRLLSLESDRESQISRSAPLQCSANRRLRFGVHSGIGDRPGDFIALRLAVAWRI